MKKYKNILTTIFAIVIFLVGLVITLLNMDVLFLLSSIGVVGLVILISWILYNKLCNSHRKVKEIFYYRDIPKQCTPAIASYMLNDKLEKDKDILATLLNLVAKKVLKIKKENGQDVFVKTNESISMTRDELYIYNWYFDDNKDDYSLLTWENIVKEEMIKSELLDVNCSKRHSPQLIIFGLIGFFLLFLFFIVDALNTNVFENSNLETVSMFFAFVGVLLIVIGVIFDKGKERIPFTEKGKELYNNLISLKRFLKEKSSLSEKSNEKIVLWEQYLSFAVALNVNLNYLKNTFNLNCLDKNQRKAMIKNIIDNLADLGS